MSIYQAPIVRDFRTLYGTLSDAPLDGTSVRDHLYQLAALLYLHHTKVPLKSYLLNIPPVVAKESSNWPPATFTFAISQECIAREHGFANWDVLEDSSPLFYAPVFELALVTLLAGEVKILQAILQEHPSVVAATAPYGHGATLLHYTASNGVEIRHQRVPSNLAEIVRLLLVAGADPQATMFAYGNPQPPLALFTSSDHPYRAGVGSEVEQLLIC